MLGNNGRNDRNKIPDRRYNGGANVTLLPDPSHTIASATGGLLQILLPESSGSGFVVNRHGLAVTNAHVVRSHREALACTPEGKTCQAPVIYADASRDLAVLRVLMLPGMTPLALADSDQTPVGEPVIAAGYPDTMGQHPGQDYTVTRGIISGKRNDNGIRYLQTDAAINPGNSGGPLVDRLGYVVGVSVRSQVDRNNISFAIAANEVREWLNRNGDRIRQDHRRPQATATPVFLNSARNSQPMKRKPPTAPPDP